MLTERERRVDAAKQREAKVDAAVREGYAQDAIQRGYESGPLWSMRYDVRYFSLDLEKSSAIPCILAAWRRQQERGG